VLRELSHPRGEAASIASCSEVASGPSGCASNA
jgi:hypothetical protein